MASTKSSAKKQVKVPFIAYFLSILTIIVGASLLLLSISAHFGLKPFLDKKAVSTQVAAKPVRLYVPKMDRTLYISDGKVEGDRWEISATGVSYLTASAMPGQVGNSVIYGHNTVDALGGLWRVHEGDFVYVILDSGQFYKYQVFERREIDPSQVDILNQTLDARLTIYTCSGFLDSARFVVVSKLQTN